MTLINYDTNGLAGQFWQTESALDFAASIQDNSLGLQTALHDERKQTTRSLPETYLSYHMNMS